jgi:hypothetical protein
MESAPALLSIVVSLLQALSPKTVLNPLAGIAHAVPISATLNSKRSVCSNAPRIPGPLASFVTAVLPTDSLHLSYRLIAMS